MNEQNCTPQQTNKREENTSPGVPLARHEHTMGIHSPHRGICSIHVWPFGLGPLCRKIAVAIRAWAALQKNSGRRTSPRDLPEPRAGCGAAALTPPAQPARRPRRCACCPCTRPRAPRAAPRRAVPRRVGGRLGVLFPAGFPNATVDQFLLLSFLSIIFLLSHIFLLLLLSSSSLLLCVPRRRVQGTPPAHEF